MAGIVGFVDFEASSLPQKWQKKDDYPIEVGAALLLPYSGSAEPRISWNAMLILHRPWLEDGLWSQGAQRLHGITKDDLIRHGESVEKVALCMNRTFSVCDRVYADSPLDVKWNRQLFEAAGLRPDFDIEHVTSICEEALFLNETTLSGIIHGEIRTVLDDEGAGACHRAGPDAARIACAFAASAVRPVDVARPPQPAYTASSAPVFFC